MKLSAKTHLILTTGAALLLIVVMAFLFWQGNELLVKRTPVLESAERIKSHTSTGYLWFEEIISGDSSENIENVWMHMDRAEWYIDALLNGAEQGGEVIYPLQSPSLRAQLVSLRGKLEELRESAQIRYRNRNTSFAGSDIDRQSDILFRRYNAEIDQMMVQFKAILRHDIRRYQLMGVLLILASTLLAYIVNRSLYLNGVKSAHLMASLTQANMEIEENNRSLHKQAHYDHLTGLPNRTLFMDRLGQLIAQADRDHASLAVLFIDLDHFKQVNDHYGHHVGDRLLELVSDRIQGAIRSTDTAARISGDEFTVILRGMPDSDTAIKTSRKIADQLVRSVCSPYHIDGVNVGISASIGIALYPDDSTVMDVLIRNADKAMYYAKSRGKNNYQFYSQEQTSRAVDMIALESDLKHAIITDQFVVYYQPCWDFISGKLSGVEASLRWNHPQQGLLLAPAFVPLAESANQMYRLELLVVSKVIAQKRVWADQQLDTGIISIKISSESFKQHGFLTSLSELFSEAEIDAGEIELGIDETLLCSNPGAQHIVKQMRQLGIKLSLDHFVVGTSSIGMLRDFPLDTLKIDGSGVFGQSADEKMDILLKYLIKMAKELNIEVVAEGIETEEQQHKLQALGCMKGLGEGLMSPLDTESLIALLQPDVTGSTLPLPHN